ncbi:hypothetical protein GY986_25250, partial [Escherichia coli]|nr:hypothetical protein [Escherichia coli]
EGYNGLGFREVRVENLLDDVRAPRGLPQKFSVGPSARENLDAAGELARLLIETMPLRSEVRLVEHAVTPLDAKLRETALEWMEVTARLMRKPPG